MKTINTMPPNTSLHGYSTVPATSDAREYLRLLLKHKLGLFLSVLLGVLLAWLYLISSTPVYQANTLLQLKDSFEIDGTRQVNFNDPGVKEEANILNSRAVLTPVVQRFTLQRQVEPRRVPVLADVALRLPIIQSWLAGFGPLSHYAWGEDTVEISKLEVPARWEDDTLLLKVLDEQHYSLSKDGTMLVERAAIGQQIRIELAQLSPMRILVTGINARPGVEFDVIQLSEQESIGSLQQSMLTETSDAKSRMITVLLNGEDPTETAEILDAITEEYVAIKLGTENADTTKELNFYQESLPGLKLELENAAAALEHARTTSGSVDQEMQRASLLRQIERLEIEKNDLDIDMRELQERYSNLHPSLRKLEKELKPIRTKLGQLNAKLNAIPKVERNLKELEEEEKRARDLYNDMNEKLQKLQLEHNASIASVTVLDRAVVPKKPVSPKPLIALVGGVVGVLFLYMLWLTLRSALSTVINDQESLERASGLPVFINIPRSSAQKRLASNVALNPRRLLPGSVDAEADEEAASANILAVQRPDDYSVENMRGLRLMLEDVMESAPNNVMMICSPLPNMGKSFVSANLAALVAQSGKRVLLIDADYLRGQLHKAFGLSMGPGLPEVVQGKSELKETVKATSVPNLYCIPRGFMSTGTTRQVPGDKEFNAFLQVVAPRFDMVIIDTPPILSVSTAATLGKHAGSSFMVVKEGEIKEPQLNEALRRLSFSGVRVNGCLLNSSSQPTPSHYAYYREQVG